MSRSTEQPVFDQNGEDIGPYEHVSFDGNLSRWIKVRGKSGPQELYCTWSSSRHRWELGDWSMVNKRASVTYDWRFARTTKSAGSRFERGKGVYTCGICKRDTRGGSGSNIRMCLQCERVSEIENTWSDGELSWEDAKTKAVPLLRQCVTKGGKESALRDTFPWAYANSEPT